jgi:hypothetical protein
METIRGKNNRNSLQHRGTIEHLKATDSMLSPWFTVDVLVNSSSSCIRSVIVGNVVDSSKVHAASVFRVEVYIFYDTVDPYFTPLLYWLASPPKRYTDSSSPTLRATCHVHPILLNLIILITFQEEYKLWSFLSSSFPQPPGILSLFGPNIILSTMVSNTVSQFSSLP